MFLGARGSLMQRAEEGSMPPGETPPTLPDCENVEPLTVHVGRGKRRVSNGERVILNPQSLLD
jgi:hypothetical protein